MRGSRPNTTVRGASKRASRPPHQPSSSSYPAFARSLGATDARGVSPQRGSPSVGHVATARADAATPDQREFFVGAGRRVVHDRRVDVIVLGGTDLPLAFEEVDPGHPVADAAVIHAEAIARKALAGG